MGIPGKVCERENGELMRLWRSWITKECKTWPGETVCNDHVSHTECELTSWRVILTDYCLKSKVCNALLTPDRTYSPNVQPVITRNRTLFA